MLGENAGDGKGGRGTTTFAFRRGRGGLGKRRALGGRGGAAEGGLGRALCLCLSGRWGSDHDGEKTKRKAR